MPKNTPLPMQWLTVDGQNIPIVLPDHWDDDKKEWKTTGTGNPLPIANYTQNASGVWLPTSESNPMPTQLTGSIDEYVRNSDEPKPSGKEGDRLFLWDTREVFLHDGTDWREV